MCGIAGIIAWDEKYRVSRALLLKMSASIAHRGPDGEGIYLTREHESITPDTPQVGFVFRRLAILDPDARAMQPMTIGPLTMVFNGEIYNFRDLKSEISKRRPDYHWRTTGDTEVLLMSYEVWREKCVEKLNGMFAIAVWDEREKTLFLARDRMGQKPLYCVAGSTGESFPPTELRMDQHGTFGASAFTSELPALRHLAWIEGTVGASEIAQYLRYGSTNWSIYESIGCIDPGCSSTVSNCEVTEQTYFSPTAAQSAAAGGIAATTRSLVERAVQRQLIS